MDLDFAPQDVAYRAKLREWLDANLEHSKFPRSDPFKAIQMARAWQLRAYEAGYVGLDWPKQYGGQEATLIQQVIAAEEFARAGVPPGINFIGLNILGPTLIKHGTEEQRLRFCPKILTAEELWCQGYSEPSAGSDLAALVTRAELDGDVFIVNGQKVWTSLGPIADWCFLLARTDPAASKRDGISMLLCDTRTPGLTIRPLRNAAGGIHFSELFFDDVAIPREQLVGQLHGGWAIARTSLDHERSGLSGVLDLERSLARLWRALSTSAPSESSGASKSATPLNDQATRRALAQLWTEVEGLRYLGYRTLSEQIKGAEPGPQAAVGKLFATELRQRLAKTALQVQGPMAQVFKRSPHSFDEGRWVTNYLDAIAYTIGGGTSEVMRNVIAERVLDLPRPADG